MAINASGGTAPRGETVTVTYPAGGLTGTTYCTMIHPVLGNITCADWTVNSDTEGTFTSPNTGTHGTSLILTIT